MEVEQECDLWDVKISEGALNDDCTFIFNRLARPCGRPRKKREIPVKLDS
jgi:hypothetical protein